MQSDDFSPRRPAAAARAAAHERKLEARGRTRCSPPPTGSSDGWGPALLGLFDACVPVVPYTPAAAFLGREKQKLVARRPGAGARRARRRRDRRHARRHAHARRDPRARRPRLRGRGHRHRHEGRPPAERGRRGRHPVLRRAARSASRARSRSSRRSPRAATGSSTCARRGRPASAAAMTARILELPLAGSYHTELAAYARHALAATARSSSAVQAALGAFYGACDVVLSPSAASDARLGELGVAAEQDRPLRPRRRHRALRPGAARAGRFGGPPTASTSSTPGARRSRRASTCSPTRSSRRRERDPRLHLLLAGGGPEEDAAARAPRRRRDVPRLARRRRRCATTYASADLLLFCSQTDTFGQVLLEAQASGLPVVAVARRRPGGADRAPAAPACCARRTPTALGAAVAGWPATPSSERGSRAAGSPRCASARGTPRWGGWRRAGGARSCRAPADPVRRVA